MKKKTLVTIVAGLAGGVILLVCMGTIFGPHEVSQVPPRTFATPSTYGPPPTKPLAKATSPISIEQQNANKAAQDYLEGQAFSRKSLIEQLKYEGYSTKASTVAVDALHADWNRQAFLCAQDYLKAQAFSRKSLIGQIEFDGFTHDQAIYGVDKTGL